MAEYIDKQDIYNAVDLLMTRFPYKVPGRSDSYSPYNEAWSDACAHVLDIIRCFQTADVKPVVRGRWYKPTGMMPPEFTGCHRCSECEELALRDWKSHKQVLTPFCPFCNADLRGGDPE